MNEENLGEQFNALTNNRFGIGVSNGAMYWKPTEEEAAQGHTGWAIPLSGTAATHWKYSDQHNLDKRSSHLSGHHMDEAGDVWSIVLRENSRDDLQGGRIGVQVYSANRESNESPRALLQGAVNHPSEVIGKIRELTNLRRATTAAPEPDIHFQQAVDYMYRNHPELSRERAQDPITGRGVDPLRSVSVFTGDHSVERVDPVDGPQFRNAQRMARVDTRTGRHVDVAEQYPVTDSPDGSLTEARLAKLAEVNYTDPESMREDIMRHLNGGLSWRENKQFKEMMKTEEPRGSGKYNPWGK